MVNVYREVDMEMKVTHKPVTEEYLNKLIKERERDDLNFNQGFTWGFIVGAVLFTLLTTALIIWAN